VAPDLAPFSGYRALLDLRAIPAGRNDEAFEQLAMRAQGALARTFSRNAVLVRSAVGKLQIRRLTHGARAVYQDEAEAIRFLVEE
jgi:hypothetical protein